MLKNILLFTAFFATHTLFAQDTYLMPGNSREIEANFMSGYYNQDGTHGAVTGGQGTEALQDFSNQVILHIPLDSINALDVYGGADYYTSASTDNIDFNPSSASAQDTRIFGTVSYTRLDRPRGSRYTVKGGFSTEYDYKSGSFGLSYTKEWNEANTELTLTGQAFIDRWDPKIPIELRRTVRITDPNRQSFNAQAIFSQILGPRLQMSLSAEVVLMRGLLSTPFHRVYFDDLSLDIERLPTQRLKLPFGLRLNYALGDFAVLRSYYRFYYDDFGILAHTVEFEPSFKLAAFTVSPFYRFHQQTASTYFAPYATHLASEEYYTSDYDLSNFSSHKLGLSLRYEPLFGILRSQPFLASQRFFVFKYIELRGGYYQRSNNLEAFFISLNLGLGLK